MSAEDRLLIEDDGNVEFLDPEGLIPLRATLTPPEHEVLERINRKVAAGETLEQVMDFLFETTHDIFPCDRIGLAFMEEKGRRAVARWGRADYEPVLLRPGFTEDTAGSTLLRVMETGRIRLIHDLERYLRDHPRSGATRLILREGVRSSMTCPLRVEGRVVGWLFRSSRRPRVYSAREALLHGAMAERLGQAVEKAWRLDRLAAANRAYLEMLGFVSHELKNPLASMIMETEVLAGGYIGELSSKQRDHVVRLKQKAGVLLDLIRKYLDLVRIEEGRLVPAFKPDVPVRAQVLDPVLLLLEPQARAKQMRVTLDAPPDAAAECDPDLLQIVFMNLVGNGIKYGREGGEVRVTLRREPDRFSAAVWNEGPGFAREEHSLLFRKFSRLPSSAQVAKGSGVGLYTVWQIIQQHGGRIRASSDPGQWAEFQFEIPQPLPAAGHAGPES